MGYAASMEDNIIFVGKKPLMNYVLAVMKQFEVGSAEIIIKARGRAISRAVDVAEVVRNRYLTNVVVKDVVIGTESMTTDEGDQVNISSIEIFLIK